MFIKPAEGRAARHPGTLRLLPAEGEHVQSSPFWLRLLANGDVVEVATTPTEQSEVTAAITETSTTVDTGEIR